MLRGGDVIRLRLRSVFKHRVESELDRELRDHIEHLVEENIARGMSPNDARYAAQRTFGNVDATKEEARDTRRTATIENLFKGLRYTLRGLLRAPVLLITAAIEVLSPDDRANEVLTKVGARLSVVTKFVWIVDPDRQEVRVHRQDGSVTIVGPDGSVEEKMCSRASRARCARCSRSP
ncbi:MAG: permease prefix domain 1-containing protein [Gemmatimonadota bacterium]